MAVKNKKEYETMVTRLDELLNLVGSNEEHPLIDLVDLLSSHISTYEEKHFQEPKGKGIDALKFLLEVHQLKQNDLPKIASQGVMSEILNGKRKLNLRQIKLLAELFHVEPGTFID